MYDEKNKKSLEELWREVYKVKNKGNKNNLANQYKDNFNYGDLEREEDEDEIEH